MAKQFINLEKALLLYGAAIEATFVKELKRNKKAGKIDKTMYFDIKVVGSVYILQLHIEDYYKYIESGRKPGTFPNVDALVKWINVKKILPKKESGITSSKQLAFLIGRKIKRDGIKPLPILSKTITITKKTFSNLIKEALQQDLNILINEELKK